MKKILLIVPLLLAGCQTAPRVPKPQPDPLPLRGAPGAYAGPASSGPPREERADERQRQLLAAFVAQNDALTARLEALEHARVQAMPEVPPPAAVVPPGAGPAGGPPAGAPAGGAARPDDGTPGPGHVTSDTSVAGVPVLTPNAEGVIDATALDAPGPGAPPDPFARRAPAGAGREITLEVQGILAGGKPCAVVDGRVVAPGETLESLRVARLEPDAVVLSGDGFDLRLPFGATRVRLAP